MDARPVLWPAFGSCLTAFFRPSVSKAAIVLSPYINPLMRLIYNSCHF